MQTYRRAWSRVTVAVVAIGGAVPLVAWCLASPLTFAAAFAAGCVARRLAVRGSVTWPVRRHGGLLVEAAVVDTWEWRVLRVLPALALSAIGWTLLLGSAGLSLLLVDALVGLPLLAAALPGGADRWPDGKRVERVPDTVEHLIRCEVTAGEGAGRPREMEQAAASGRVSPALWPGPRTLLPDLDDTELWHAWEASARVLRQRPDPASVLAILTARARYLDALAERDPEGSGRRLALEEPDDWPVDPPS